MRFVWSRAGGYDALLAQWMIYFAGVFVAINLTATLILILRHVFKLSVMLLRGIKSFAATKLKQHKAIQSNTPGNTPEFDPGRRNFLQIGGRNLVLASFGAPVLAAMSTTREYHINNVVLSFENLPAGLEGLTIVHISDIHSGVFMTEKQIFEIFEIINSLAPNLIAITGDFIDSANAEIPAIYNTIDMLKSDYGIFGCLGNHDHFANAEMVSDALTQKNVQLLNNAHSAIRINDEKLTIIGIDDAGRGLTDFSDIQTAMKGVDANSFKILLSHRPAFFPEAQRFDIDLTLSGHTHGGQVLGDNFGIEINPIRYFHRYLEGQYQENGKQLYVNVGVGVAAVPIRLVPREITKITLRKSV